MAVSRCLHVRLFDTVEHVSALIMDQLMTLVHRLRRLLIVSTADKVQLRRLSDLHALVVVGQGDLEAIDAIVELDTIEAVRRTIVLDQDL